MLSLTHGCFYFYKWETGKCFFKHLVTRLLPFLPQILPPSNPNRKVPLVNSTVFTYYTNTQKNRRGDSLTHYPNSPTIHKRSHPFIFLYHFLVNRLKTHLREPPFYQTSPMFWYKKVDRSTSQWTPRVSESFHHRVSVPPSLSQLPS